MGVCGFLILILLVFLTRMDPRSEERIAGREMVSPVGGTLLKRPQAILAPLVITSIASILLLVVFNTSWLNFKVDQTSSLLFPPSNMSMECVGKMNLHDEVTVPPIWWTTSLEKPDATRSVCELATSKAACGSCCFMELFQMLAESTRHREGDLCKGDYMIKGTTNDSSRNEQNVRRKRYYRQETDKSGMSNCQADIRLSGGHCAWRRCRNGLFLGSSDAHISCIQQATCRIPGCPGVHEQCTCECCCEHANMQAHAHVHTVYAQLGVDHPGGVGMTSAAHLTQNHTRNMQIPA